MYCIPSFSLLVITECGIIGTCIMHQVITLIKYNIWTTIPYLYRNTYFASNFQTYHLPCNFTQFLCGSAIQAVLLTHKFFLSLSKVLVINNRIHHMAWKGDLKIHTQCLYNGIQYVLTPSPPSSQLRYSTYLNQNNHQFSILHAFLLSLENPCQVQKKTT